MRAKHIQSKPGISSSALLLVHRPSSSSVVGGECPSVGNHQCSSGSASRYGSTRTSRTTRTTSSASSTKVEPQHQGGTTAATVDDIAATVAPMVSALESLSARIGTMEQLVGSLVEKVNALEQVQQQWNLRWDAEDGGGDEHQNWPPAPRLQ